MSTLHWVFMLLENVKDTTNVERCLGLCLSIWTKSLSAMSLQRMSRMPSMDQLQTFLHWTHWTSNKCNTCSYLSMSTLVMIRTTSKVAKAARITLVELCLMAGRRSTAMQMTLPTNPINATVLVMMPCKTNSKKWSSSSDTLDMLAA